MEEKELLVEEPALEQEELVEAPKAGGNGKGLSVAGLVLGIITVVLAFIPYISYVAWLLGVIGIVLAALGMKKDKVAGGKHHGLAVAGLVLSIIGTAIGFLGLLCVVLVIAAL